MTEQFHFNGEELEDMLPDPEVCIGHVFKCKENIYRNKRGVIVYKTEMISVKRKSCPGCSKCCFLDEYIDESIDCDMPPYWDKPLKHNKLYVLIDRPGVMSNPVDGSDDLVFVEYVEQEDKT